MDWIFRAKNIKKEFRTGHSLIYGDELVIKRHRMTFITGDSGVGKSTLLHMLALLDRASGPGGGDAESESCLLFKPDAASDCGGRSREIDYFKLYKRMFWRRRCTEIRRKCFGILPQQGHLLHHLSVRENLELVFRLRGSRGKTDLDKKIAGLLSELELEDMCNERNGLPELNQQELKRSPACLSGGEAQRLAVARTIINSPSVIFVDEPTTFLNRRLVDRTIDLLIEEIRKKKCSVIVVTHQYEDFFALLENRARAGSKIEVDHFSLEPVKNEKGKKNEAWIRIVHENE